jgi:hypothetical protein
LLLSVIAPDAPGGTAHVDDAGARSTRESFCRSRLRFIRLLRGPSALRSARSSRLYDQKLICTVFPTDEKLDRLITLLEASAKEKP